MDIEEIKVGSNRKRASIITSVRVTPEFYNLAVDNNIKFAEAMRVGLSVMFADAGLIQYDNELNLFRKMKFFQTELEKMSKEFEIMRIKLKRYEPDIQKEDDNKNINL